jgi:hypothetical protein
MIGGVGSGKSRTLMEAAVSAAVENPGCDGMLVAPTFPMLWRILIPAWEKACPRELRPRHLKGEQRYVMWHGGSVWYGTAKDPSSLEGTNLAWYAGDESRYWPRQSHVNMLSRLRLATARSLQGMYATTPGMGWLEEEFNTGRLGRRAFRMSTRENAKNLDPDFIPNLERTLSPRQAKAIIEGFFTVLEGQVYEEYDESRHLIDWEYDPSLATWIFWDFGIRQAAILFAQSTGDLWRITRDGRQIPPHSLILFGEIMPEQKPTKAQVPLAKAWLKGRPVHRIACDPAGKQRSQESGMQNIQVLQEAFERIVGWEEDFVERHIPNRIARVQGALSPSDGSPPTLYFARSLTQHPNGSPEARRGIVQALRGVVYPEKQGRQTSDIPVESELTHAIDALEYGVVHHQNRSRRPTTLPRPALKFGHR